MKKESEVIARVIANTRRKKRTLSIIDIAEDIKWLKNHLGSLASVASTVSLSTDMLNQFLRVEKLAPELKELVKSRDIDKVSIVHNLVKFPHKDQKCIADYLHHNKLVYSDLRLLNSLRTQSPTEDVRVLIDKLNNSKNIKTSVIQVPSELVLKDIKELTDDIGLITGKNEILSVDLNDKIVSVTLTKKGEKYLREEARKQKKDLQSFFYNLIK